MLYVPTTNPVSSEFIQIQLADSLGKSHYYCVSFYVSLADSSNYAIASLGAYFSKQLVTLSEIEDNNFIPQIENSVDSMLNDKVNWKKISGYYYADGGEIFLTIGNFYNNANTVSLYIGGASFMFNSAYYYIDDVSVVQCDSLFNSVNELVIKPIKLYPNPSQNEVNILFNDATATEAFVEIHDLLGKLIERVPLKSGVAYNYNTQSLQKSIYLVSLYINGKLVDNQKLVLVK